MSLSVPLDFAGTTRFVIRRRLGAGGMGVVYEAFDRERSEVVALKTLKHTEPSAIYRIKKEFRALAEVVHPNLVSLHELIADSDTWFFTMELVDGVDFIEHVRGVPIDPSSTPTQASRLPDPWLADSPATRTASRAPRDLDRLRAALRQLAQGVLAIHEAGHLHRDLKPSNVLVDPAGRVVILDMGLCIGLNVDGATLTVEDGLVGTVRYISPEQGAGGTASEASDLYAVGVMLYEGLTGTPPFAGNPLKVLHDKRARAAPSPAELVPALPSDLIELCVALLDREPGGRPTCADVLRALGGGDIGPPLGFVPPRRSVELIGRETQLGELERALRSARAGGSVAVYVHGPSGIGKTALVREALDRAHKSGALVFEGRCYVLETVPFKGVDGVMDSLSRVLRSLSWSEAEELIPAGVAALARLFPSLSRAAVIARACERDSAIPDPVELRRRGVSALRELLRRIGRRHPVVVHIDDLQWADRDSANLILDLLRPPEAPPLLFIASFRSEEIEAQGFLRDLLRTGGALEVGPLTREESIRLARAHFARPVDDQDPAIEVIVREAGGIPFLIEQMARYSRETPGRENLEGIRLPRMLIERLGQLAPGAREMVEVLAVAGHPLDAAVAFRAAGLEGDERQLVKLLGGAHFVRRSGSARTIELYHDRIRQTLIGRLDEIRVSALHGRIARSLEAAGFEDPEALFEHYHGAGDRALASLHAARAATKAEAALAFERAADFYRQALELADDDDPTRASLPEHLGDALANAGRGVEAAAAYLQQVRASAEEIALRLRRKAAEQLLRCGHIDEGLEITSAVLDAAGLRLSRTGRRALFQVLARRVLLRLRGLRFRERSPEEVSPETLTRLDICWAVAIGLARVDNIRAAEFQVRHLRLALRAGEPYRVARALAAEAAFVSTRGPGVRRRSGRLVRATTSLAERLGHPQALGLARLAAGITAFYVGDFNRAFEQCRDAEEILRSRCSGVVWERTTAQSYILSSLFYMGRFNELSRGVDAALDDADKRGDLYARADAAAGRGNAAWLAQDDPLGARREIDESMAAWSHRGFHFQHYVALLARGHVALYSGHSLEAWQNIQEEWRRLSRTHLLRIAVIRVEGYDLRARLALAAAAESAPDRRRLLSAAARDARRIARERIAFAEPMAAALSAGLARARGDTENAVRGLERATSGFERLGMAFHHAAAQRQLGRLLGRLDGVRAADEWMGGQGIRNPARMTRLALPGFDAQPTG